MHFVKQIWIALDFWKKSVVVLAPTAVLIGALISIDHGIWQVHLDRQQTVQAIQKSDTSSHHEFHRLMDTMRFRQEITNQRISRLERAQWKQAKDLDTMKTALRMIVPMIEHAGIVQKRRLIARGIDSGEYTDGYKK